MNKHYVSVNEDGYIQGWSDNYLEKTVLVENVDDSLVGILEYAKLENGKIFIDEDMKKKIDEKYNTPNPIEQLQAGLAQASFQVMQSGKNIEELTKQNAAMGFKIMQLEQNQNTESEVN